MPSPETLLERLLARAEVGRALDALAAGEARALAAQREVTEIPAPTGAEGERAAWLAARLAAAGAEEVATDEAGNVTAMLAGGEGPPVIVAAHLDTVFPADADVAVREAEGRLLAPGIADNGRGLAALVALAEAWRTAELRAPRRILLAGTVGEEGRGDLRGARHLLREDGPWRGAAAFVAVDGGGLARIVHRGVGSRRLRFEVRGPGGHSWSDWGRANAAHVLGRFVAAAADLAPPEAPRTTLTVARLGGGTSINAIPAEAWAEVDLRSEGQAELAALERRVRALFRRAVRAVDGAVGRIRVIGDRPAGATPADHPLVALAAAATAHVGGEPELTASSTDANVAMALGIPALALGAGGEAGGTHTPAEWFDPRGGTAGLQRCLLVVLGAGEPAP